MRIVRGTYSKTRRRTAHHTSAKGFSAFNNIRLHLFTPSPSPRSRVRRTCRYRGNILSLQETKKHAADTENNNTNEIERETIDIHRAPVYRAVRQTLSTSRRINLSVWTTFSSFGRSRAKLLSVPPSVDGYCGAGAAVLLRPVRRARRKSFPDFFFFDSPSS